MLIAPLEAGESERDFWAFAVKYGGEDTLLAILIYFVPNLLSILFEGCDLQAGFVYQVLNRIPDAKDQILPKLTCIDLTDPGSNLLGDYRLKTFLSSRSSQCPFSCSIGHKIRSLIAQMGVSYV